MSLTVEGLKIRAAAEAIQTADALLITAGAGMGVDSGLPDFRGAQGFWRAYPTIASLGLSFEEIANPAHFRDDPTLAWAFYGHRLSLYRSAAPHSGFNRLLEMGRSKPLGHFVVTSNVDGHFQRAGFLPERIVECHGSIHHLQCCACCTDEIWGADGEVVAVDKTSFRALEPLPRCRNCPSLSRPNILMFGDASWLSHRTDQQYARFSTWLESLAAARATIAVVEIGAGTALPTIRQISERVAQRMNRKLIRINLREPGVPSGHIGLSLRASEAIGEIYQRFDATGRPKPGSTGLGEAP